MKSCLLFYFALCAAEIVSATEALQPSGTIPVIYIDTDGHAGITSKEEYVGASLWIDPCDSGFEELGDESDPVRLQIKGRGNASWQWIKKPYRLKFDEKEKPLDMESNRHFVLLVAHNRQRGCISTPAGMILSEYADLDWTPDLRPVELVLNGEYEGLYFLVEKIRPGKQRVDIIEQDDMESDLDEIESGGWLVEIDNYFDEQQVNLTAYANENVTVTSHSPELMSSEQRHYLLQQMIDIDSAIYDPDKESERWERLVDPESIAKFYFVNEYLECVDAFDGSCYLFKRGGDEDKWNFGPVWDFDWVTVGQDFIYNETRVTNHWIREWRKFPRFMKYVKEVAEDFFNNDYHDYIDDLRNIAAEMKDAVAADAERWPHPDYGCFNFPDRFDEFVNALNDRRRFLAQNWDIELVDDEQNGLIDVEDGAFNFDVLDGDVVSVWDLSGKQVASGPLKSFDHLKSGFYIVKSKHRTVKIMITRNAGI